MQVQPLTRLINERRILTLLRVAGPLTRADMARSLDLVPATLTNLIDALRKRRLVQETDSVARVADRTAIGRPGIKITLVPNGAYFLGVEIGVGIIRFALLDLALGVAASETHPAPRDISPAAAVAVIAAYLARLTGRPEYDGRIHAVVLTVPGLVRSDGYVVHLPILGWRDVELGALATAAFGLTATVENNANAAAFGEVYLRPKLERDCIIYLKLGTGCGGAAILNGRLLRGAFGMAAEFGHIEVSATGARCNCGRTGCLEAQVNFAALARLVAPGRQLDDAALRSLPAAVVRAARNGDEVAREAIRHIADALATGLASLVNAFNPRTIVLGGPVSGLLAQAVDDLREAVARRTVSGMTLPQIELSSFGAMECAIGAATIAHHQAVDFPSDASKLNLTYGY